MVVIALFNHWQNTEGGGGARNEWGGSLINELPITFFLYSSIANDRLFIIRWPQEVP